MKISILGNYRPLGAVREINFFLKTFRFFKAHFNRQLLVVLPYQGSNFFFAMAFNPPILAIPNLYPNYTHSITLFMIIKIDLESSSLLLTLLQLTLSNPNSFIDAPDTTYNSYRCSADLAVLGIKTVNNTYKQIQCFSTLFIIISQHFKADNYKSFAKYSSHFAG